MFKWFKTLRLSTKPKRKKCKTMKKRKTTKKIKGGKTSSEHRREAERLVQRIQYRKRLVKELNKALEKNDLLIRSISLTANKSFFSNALLSSLTSLFLY